LCVGNTTGTIQTKTYGTRSEIEQSHLFKPTSTCRTSFIWLVVQQTSQKYGDRNQQIVCLCRSFSPRLKMVLILGTCVPRRVSRFSSICTALKYFRNRCSLAWWAGIQLGEILHGAYLGPFHIISFGGNHAHLVNRRKKFGQLLRVAML
jgi:hypothetical protein